MVIKSDFINEIKERIMNLFPGLLCDEIKISIIETNKDLSMFLIFEIILIIFKFS